MQHSQERSVTNLPCYNREHENASKEEQLHFAYLRLLRVLISLRKSNCLNRGARVVIVVLQRDQPRDHLIYEQLMWVMSTTNREPRLSCRWPRPHKKMKKKISNWSPEIILTPYFLYFFCFFLFIYLHRYITFQNEDWLQVLLGHARHTHTYTHYDIYARKKLIS